MCCEKTVGKGLFSDSYKVRMVNNAKLNKLGKVRTEMDPIALATRSQVI